MSKTHDVTKTVLQIENIKAIDLINRLSRIESAIAALSGTPQPTATEIASDYITRRDVATRFRVTVTTIQNWTRKGILQDYNIGGSVFYKRLDVESALTKRSKPIKNHDKKTNQKSSRTDSTRTY